MSTKFRKFLDQNLWPMLILGSLTGLVAFSFAVLKIANQNPTDLVAPDYYARGYNLKDVVATEQATAATGWSVEVLPLSPDQTGDLILQLNITGNRGEPVDSVRGACSLYRPSDAMLDVLASDLVFIGRGRYIRYLPRILEQGRWDAVVELERDSSRFVKRIPFMVNE